MKKLRAVDIITFLYISFNLLYILFGWTRVHNPLKHFLTFSFIGIIILLLKSLSSKSKIVAFFYDWYPMFAFTYFFESASALNKVIFPHFLDSFFQKIDFAIFGYQPAMYWGTHFSNFFLQEFLHFGYFCYYLMFPGVGFYYYFKNRKIFYRFVFSISFLFYLCYLIYAVFPVVGGRALPGAMELTKIYRYGIFTRIMAFIYNNTKHLGGAFPSSHVAVAFAVTISALRNEKRLGWILLFITFLLSVATVYCHYHYFIDTVAGLIFGAAIFYLSLVIYRKLETDV